MEKPRFTDVQLITDNRAAWQAKRRLVAQAEHSLDLVYFIVEDDATTARLLLDLVAAAQRGVRVRLVLDYFLTYQHADLLRALVDIPKLEVRRYRAPETTWVKSLTEAGIEPTPFISALTKPSAELLRASLKDNPVIPQQALMVIENLKVKTGESRWSFALNVLEALREAITDPHLIERIQPAAISHLGRLARGFSSGPSLSFGTLRQLGEMVVPLVEIVRGLDQFLHRTHHKLLLADNRCFIMGGRNLADAYQREAHPGERAFTDTDVQACANTAGAAEHATAFEALWQASVELAAADSLDQRPARPLASLELLAAGCEDVDPQAALASVVALPDMDGSIFNNLPSDSGDVSITAEYVRRINAQSTQGSGAIDIVSAYVCLGGDSMGSDFLHQLYQSLLAAAHAHVTVNIRTNSASTTDLKAINKAAYAELAELMDAGVNVFELDDEQGTLHTKAAAIGDEYLLIGSYNMDPRSELYDTNNMIVLRDPSGTATQAFRKASIESLKWTQLTADRARQLAALDPSKVSLLSIPKRLL